MMSCLSQIWSVPRGGGGPTASMFEPARSPLPTELLARPVLVIEDEALLAWMLESLLSDLGFSEILMAASASEAIRLLADRRPGAIVSDINLGPGVPDGIEAVGMLAPDASVPVIFVTAHADPVNRARIAEAFARHAIVSKPVALETLATALHAALEGPGIH